MIAQEPPKPNPMPPSSDALGAQLIAWSELQKPQPVSRPEPDRSKHSDSRPDKAVHAPTANPPSVKQQVQQTQAKDADRQAAEQK